jgi:hypothetical protein
MNGNGSLATASAAAIAPAPAAGCDLPCFRPCGAASSEPHRGRKSFVDDDGRPLGAQTGSTRGTVWIQRIHASSRDDSADLPRPGRRRQTRVAPGIYGGEKGEVLRGDAGVESDGHDHRSLRLHLPAPPR